MTDSHSQTHLSAVLGDITRAELDAIVNAANERLLGGGGVDGAIHRAAGPDLLAACRAIGGCPTGEARVTPGFRLPASYVIHTVGPIWRGGDQGEAERLSSCYRSSLSAAARQGARSVAFPAISTGVYGYPANEAADIAVTSVRTWLAEHPDSGIEEVRFYCFDEDMLSRYRRSLQPAP